MSASKANRWFITGVSSGLGRQLAVAVVKSGGKVIGTVRKASQIAELAEDGIDAIKMDVNEQSEVDAAVAFAQSRLGGVDVIVNNAGFAMVGAIEALSIDEARAVMETNFFGVLRVTQAFMTAMRASGGTIVMISSMAGQIGFAGTGAYCASKFALEGMSDALAEELAPFDVRVLIVEPGAFRTDFAGRSIQGAACSVAAYAGTQAGDAKSMMVAYHGHEPGDPAKGAQAIIDVVNSAAMPRRLALGADAVNCILQKLDSVRSDIDGWRNVSIGTAFESSAA
jgi:NAD(P)-dependent dehydrogenase (short-subunit alcohol dehydrogenase family)